MDNDTRLKSRLLFNVAVLLALIGCVYGAIGTIRGELATGLPAAVFGMSVGALALNFRQRRDLVIFNNGITGAVALLLLYFLAQGGVAGTGPVWAALFPVLSFYLYGLRRGVMVNGAYLAGALAVLFFPGNALLLVPYDTAFKLSVLGAMACNSVLSYFLQYTRELTLQDRSRALKALELAATTDPLTGLVNRRHMLQRLNYTFNDYRRHPQPFCIAIVDVDHFKNVNDTYGHLCGDAVLVELATRLRAELRQVDQVARWGGEEFLILLPHTTLEEARIVLDRLRRGVEQHPFRFRARTVRITLSIGVAMVAPGVDRDQLEGLADQSLYQAKQQGRNRVVAAEPAASTPSRPLSR